MWPRLSPAASPLSNSKFALVAGHLPPPFGARTRRRPCRTTTMRRPASASRSFRNAEVHFHPNSRLVCWPFFLANSSCLSLGLDFDLHTCHFRVVNGCILLVVCLLTLFVIVMWVLGGILTWLIFKPMMGRPTPVSIVVLWPLVTEL